MNHTWNAHVGQVQPYFPQPHPLGSCISSVYVPTLPRLRSSVIPESTRVAGIGTYLRDCECQYRTLGAAGVLLVHGISH